MLLHLFLLGFDFFLQSNAADMLRQALRIASRSRRQEASNGVLDNVVAALSASKRQAGEPEQIESFSQVR